MKILLFFTFFLYNLVFSQNATVFNVIKTGTLQEMEKMYLENPKIINEVNKYGTSILIMACYKNKDEFASFLIEKHADINFNSENGTALMAATVRGNNSLCEKLLQNGADPNLTDNNGVTALMYAIQFNNIPLIELLLKYNANKTLINKERKSTFEYAIDTKNEQIINLIK